jgi:plasmid maintenance system antidote protein VapI
MTESIHPIDDVLAEYGVTSYDLAVSLGLSVEAVRTWRRGTRRITPEAARLTEQRFGVPKHLLRPDLWEPSPPPVKRRRRTSETAA